VVEHSWGEGKKKENTIPETPAADKKKSLKEKGNKKERGTSFPQT